MSPVRAMVPALALLLSATAATTTATTATAAATAAPAPSRVLPTVDRADERRAGRPNIVLVMADDMRVDDLDFAPNVRRLVARRGLSFENSFSPFPLCCPARTSFLTGSYAHNHGVLWHDAPYGYAAFDDSRTIATSLRRAGYRTGFVGKYVNGYGSMRSKVSGGPSYRYVPKGWTDWRAGFENPGADGIHGGTYYYWDTPYNVNGRVDNDQAGEYQTVTIADFALDIIRGFARASDPFFVWVSFVAPHHGGPTEPDDPSGDSFKTPARPGWVRGRFDDVVRRPSGMPRRGPSERDVSDKPEHFQQLPEVRGARRAALTEVTRQRAEAVYVMDRQVGRLVRGLKAAGEWRDTVLVFTSDNGYFLGEHRKVDGKVRAHEPSLRVPLLVTGPGMRGGEKRYDPISTIDLTATFLDIAGARPPHPADGTSRWASMRRGDRGWTQPVVTESIHTSSGGDRAWRWFPQGEPRTALGVRTPRYSYTRYRNGEAELYDLREDPLQQRNRYGDGAVAGTQDLLDDALRAAKDCAGADCRAPLPPELQATAGEARTLTRHYWKVVDRRYGR